MKSWLGESKKFSKTEITLVKCYIIEKKRFGLKIHFLKCFLANFIFVASHLKLHPAVHLNTVKALTYL